MSGPSAKVIGPRVAAIRKAPREIGRNGAEILMFSMMTIIVGRTDAEARPNTPTIAATSIPRARWR